MNDMIKNSIEGRKNSIFNVYEVKDKALLKEIDDLFARMTELGKSCNDVMEFETKLANSPLNQEYIDLFTKISQSSKYILKEQPTETKEIKSDAEYLKEEIESDSKRMVKDATMPLRRNAREHAMGKLRTTPIIGDILGVKQHLDLFGGIKRRKKAKEEQQALQEELNKEMAKQNKNN